ncbi:MAG: 5'/3'-nucleotidase SurE [Wolbachia endosymbiont of Menacanthus eurysternus]|nr:MAG: 5'/3'-nucleotidase SurE [Wolbachia endosymbiont of Menacanthus eurysternus]
MVTLITNDDGYKSEGIKLLKKIAQNFASEIWIVAPNSDRSGAARSLDYLISHSIKITQHSKKEFSISGTPADCIITALNKIMDKRPDLILSGVNIGSNVGDDVYYSGTIGAVMEGAAKSIPSIAISQVYHNHNRINWHNTKTFGLKIITKLIEVGWPKNIAMSVNLPDIEKIKGIEFVEQGEYNNIDGNLTFIENPDGSLNLNWSREYSGSGSVGKIKEGFITITPIKLDFTDYDTLNIMKSSYADKFSHSQ